MGVSYQLKVENSKNINYAFFLLNSLLILGLLWNGFYLEKSKLTFLLLGSLLCSLYWTSLYKKKKEIKIDFFNTLFLISIFITVFNLFFSAINTRTALLENIILYVGFGVFLYFRESDRYCIARFLDVLFGGIAFIAILGILSYTDILNIPGSIFKYRLQSTLQYANTAAILFLISFIYGIGRQSTKVYRYLEITASYFCFFSILLTLSRAVFLMILPIIFLDFYLREKNSRFEFAFNGILISITSIISLPFFVNLVKTRQIGLAWGLILINIAIILVITSSKQSMQKVNFNPKFKNILLILGIFLVIFSSFYVVNNSSYFQRVKNFDVTSNTRFVIYKDSLKVFKDYPILGVGEGGWKTLYTTYQDKPYISTEIHSNILKILINTGLIGFLTYIIFWLGFFYYLLKNLRRYNTAEPKIKNQISFLITSTIAIFTHSIFDFNLSYPIVTLIYWGLVGATLNQIQRLDVNEYSLFKKNISFKWLNIGMSLMGIIFVVISSSLFFSYSNGEEGLKLINNRDYEQGIEKLKTAVELDPFSSRYTFALAKTLEALSPNERDLIEKYYKDSLEITPYSADINKNFALYLIKHRNYHEGGEYLDRALQYDPFGYNNYPQLASGYLKLANLYLNKRDMESAKKYFNKIAEIYNNRVPKKYITPQVNFVLAQIEYYNGNYPKALKYINFAEKYPKLKNEILLWKALIFYRLDRRNESNEILTVLNESRPDLVKQFEYIGALNKKNQP